MTHLNVSLNHPDPQLAKTLDNIADEERVGDLAAAATVPPIEVTDIIRLLQVQQGEIVLDLIAHARGGVLQFGTWLITATDANLQSIKDAIEPNGVDVVRLLGCYTASTHEGVEALKRVKRVFGSATEVFGVGATIDAHNFGTDGFKAAYLDLTQEVFETTVPPPPISNKKVAGDFARLARATTMSNATLRATLREETRPAAEQAMLARYPGLWKMKTLNANAIFPSLDMLLGTADDFRLAPGLLAIPDGELLYPVGNSGRFHRVTSLFGGRMLRVYPQAHPSGVLLLHRGQSLF